MSAIGRMGALVVDRESRMAAIQWLHF